ncbi:DUF429 domain-containing protein [Marispirochaeta aestuarii]|uniref:DUF429 domain-containing protein n=1 Tax=Marispirochaeta aestuarii TaxID=1963862 RepID=UPI002ABE9FFA|nr:DUF429 domain-containing protein [Marispirochaeta aestuarii]
MSSVLLIGIDCAVDPSNTGLCLAQYRKGEALRVLEACSGFKDSPAEIAARWIAANPGLPVLLGMDAPLGWPVSLSEALRTHRAGDVLPSAANELFRRYTDVFTARAIGKRPMDVGADRIARTAHAALRLLDEIRRLSSLSFSPGWDPRAAARSAVLETYPAAWLKVSGLPDRSYKKKEQLDQRKFILAELEKELFMEVPREPFLEDADILDALVCTLVCRDYREGRVIRPPAEKESLVRREGWIWLSDYSGSVPAITSR